MSSSRATCPRAHFINIASNESAYGASPTAIDAGKGADLSPFYEELAAIFRKTIGLTSLLKEALSDFGDRIHVAFVFGSMASGRQSAGSDLDICVLGEVSLLEVVTALSAVQETVRREVNPVVMTTTKFSSLAEKGDRFATRVLSEPKLFVKANEDELAEAV